MWYRQLQTQVPYLIMKLIVLCAAIVSVSLGQPSKRQKTYHNDGTLSNCDCGSRNSGRIVGGKETRRNEYPWMVVINCGPKMCGGSIITPFHVLTAAHCVYGLRPRDIEIFVGRHDISSVTEGENHFVDKIIRHQHFTENPQLFNDIAVLVTKEEIIFNRNVGPVCLPSRRFNLEGKELKVTGWGETRGTGNEDTLQEADLRFVSLERCEELRPRPYTILTDTLLCAHNPNKDVCTGDSGGPLMYLNPGNSRYAQVGLLSFNEFRCESRMPSVYTDVFSFIGWIINVISKSKRGVKACAGN